MALRTSQRNERSTVPAESRARPEVPNALPAYLREMGEFQLLAKSEEGKLSRRLQDARAALAAIALGLPAAVRRYVLAGASEGPRLGRQWPLKDVEGFYDRLMAYVRENDDPRLRRPVREARREMTRMRQARDAMILSNLRLVIHVAKKFLNNGVAFMDLIQEGNIGLMKAVEKFEHQRGYRFSTYAYWWIKQAITRAIADKAATIRIPIHMGEKMKKVAAAKTALRERLGREPRPREIANELGMPLAKVAEILEAGPDVLSFEELRTRDDDGPSPLQVLSDPEAPSPHDLVLENELKREVEHSLGLLEPREAIIIRRRFGIDDDEPHTLEEIGREINLSRERVRQIERHALRKIADSRSAFRH